MSETVAKTLLTGSGSNGFVVDSYSGFDSLSVSTLLSAIKSPTATPGDYDGTFQQGITANKYSDWGVPAGAKILGLKLLGANSSLTHAGTGSGDVQILTNEANLGTQPFGSIGEGTYVDLSPQNLTADSYVRVLVNFLCAVAFDGFESYGELQAQINQIQFEVTYQKLTGGMFFGAN